MRLPTFALLAALTVALSRSPAVAQPADTWAQEREAMVAEQMESRDISDSATLAAMRAVPRHEFVPEELRPLAYADEPLPIGHGQTISQPYIVAYMTQALDLASGERVLEVGTGSGYQAAVLAQIVGEVHTIEIIPALAQRAEQTLRRTGCAGVQCREGDGYYGWPEAAPFDAIVVTAAATSIPPPLVEQLAPGGRMIVPVGDTAWSQNLVLVTKSQDGDVRTHVMLPVRFVPLTGEGHE